MKGSLDGLKLSKLKYKYKKKREEKNRRGHSKSVEQCQQFNIICQKKKKEKMDK